MPKRVKPVLHQPCAPLIVISEQVGRILVSFELTEPLATKRIAAQAILRTVVLTRCTLELSRDPPHGIENI